MTAAELIALNDPLTVSFTVKGPVRDAGGFAFHQEMSGSAAAKSFDAWQERALELHLADVVQRLKSFSLNFSLAFHGADASRYLLSHDPREGEPYVSVLARDPVAIGFRLKGDDVEIAVGLHGALGEAIANGDATKITLTSGRSPRWARASASSLINYLACLAAQVLVDNGYETSKTTGSAQPMVHERADETAVYRRYTAQAVVDDFFTLDPRTTTPNGPSYWRLSELERFERVEALAAYRDALETQKCVRILVPFLEHELNILHLVEPSGQVALSFDGREIGVSFAPRPGADAFVALENREMDVIQKITAFEELPEGARVASHVDWISAGGHDLSASDGLEEVRGMRAGPTP